MNVSPVRLSIQMYSRPRNTNPYCCTRQLIRKCSECCRSTSGPSPTGEGSHPGPSAYILPKRKKDFATGRPIVSFVQAQGRALWESFADVLYLMIRQACPDTLGEGSGIFQLQQIKQHFSSLSNRTYQEPSMREDVTCVNQDLAVFFTLSSDRFLDSHHLLQHWYEQRNTRHATTFTVAHSESLPDARVHRGSHKQASHTTTTRLQRRSLHIQEFPDIISAILQLNSSWWAATWCGKHEVHLWDPQHHQHFAQWSWRSMNRHGPSHTGNACSTPSTCHQGCPTPTQAQPSSSPHAMWI